MVRPNIYSSFNLELQKVLAQSSSNQEIIKLFLYIPFLIRPVINNAASEERIRNGIVMRSTPLCKTRTSRSSLEDTAGSNDIRIIKFVLLAYLRIEFTSDQTTDSASVGLFKSFSQQFIHRINLFVWVAGVGHVYREDPNFTHKALQLQYSHAFGDSYKLVFCHTLVN
jgi:hypothetical protein